MPHTVIIGAGIIGVSTAYYLSHSPSSKADHIITILDPCKPASGASGKAAGFLSRTWTSEATSSLEGLSFQLYRDLAEQYRGAEEWGYRQCEVLTVTAGKVRSSEKVQWSETGPKTMQITEYTGELNWVKPDGIESQSLLGDPDSFAQW
jgi:glycine/D-amino acid oxidase-like deaminating enzyme